MNRTRHKCTALVFFLLLALLIAVPVGLMWRQIWHERLNRALVEAVRRNDDKAVVSWLNLGANANCRDEPPHKTNVWQTLLQMVQGRKSQPSLGSTPLLIALEWEFGRYSAVSRPENLRLVTALVDHGAQVNQPDEFGTTPIDWAIRDFKNASARMLLAHGAIVHQNTGGSFAPLVFAAADSRIDTDLVTGLLDHGADVNQRDDQGYTALYRAVDFCRVGVVPLLLARHADVSLRCKGSTPLARALQDESPEGRQIAHLLKAAGAKK